MAADLGLLDGDNNVLKMAKHMAVQMEVNGHVNLGTVVIKKLHVLIFWIKDHQMRSLDIDTTNWDQAVMATAMEAKHVHKEMKNNKKPPYMRDIMKFNPNRYELCKDAFLNILSQMIGANSAPLHYIVHDDMPLDEFQNGDEERMYQIPHEGEAF